MTGLDRPSAGFFATAAVLTAAVAGSLNGPQQPAAGAWYAMLRKPRLTPPGPVIGAAWTGLEVLLLATGYRLLRSAPAPARTTALSAWGVTLACLAGYPWLLFRQRRLASSGATAVAMLASATCMAEAARRIDPPAAAMNLPLLAWLGFASVLNEELWRRNPHLSRD